MNNNTYNEQKNNNEYNKTKLTEFLNIMRQMKEAKNYEERVAIMKELWGNVKDCPKTFHYGDLCSVTIKYKNGQYKFQFNCKDCSYNELHDILPDLTEEIYNQCMEKLKHNNS